MSSVLSPSSHAVCIPSCDDMLRMQRIVSDELYPLVCDDGSYPYDIYRKVEELWSYLDPSLDCVVREWAKYSVLDSFDVLSLYEALRSRDANESVRQVRELARQMGVIL